MKRIKKYLIPALLIICSMLIASCGNQVETNQAETTTQSDTAQSAAETTPSTQQQDSNAPTTTETQPSAQQQQSGSTTPEALSDSQTPSTPQTRIFTDVQGVDIELPVDVQKVIHLWPASTAFHVFLGTGDKIDGVLGGVQGPAWGWLNSACPHLLEAEAFAGDASAEELLKLAPDVVITSNKELAVNLRAQGVPIVCMLAGEDMDSFKVMLLKMGELLGPRETAKAQEYVAYLDGIIQEVNAAIKDIPEEQRVRLYYNSAQMGDSALLTCGYGSIVQSWIDATGCINVVEDVIQGMDKEVNIEVILAADPDYILVGGINQEKTYNDILTDPAWQSLTAVKEGRMIRNPQGVMKWEKTGVEIALQLQWFTALMYPDYYSVDIEAAVREFYSNYYGYQLTEQNYQDLMAGMSAPQ